MVLPAGGQTVLREWQKAGVYLVQQLIQRLVCNHQRLVNECVEHNKPRLCSQVPHEGNDILDVAAWSLYLYYKDANDDGSSILHSHPYVIAVIGLQLAMRLEEVNLPPQGPMWHVEGAAHHVLAQTPFNMRIEDIRALFVAVRQHAQEVGMVILTRMRFDARNAHRVHEKLRAHLSLLGVREEHELYHCAADIARDVFMLPRVMERYRGRPETTAAGALMVAVQVAKAVRLQQSAAGNTLSSSLSSSLSSAGANVRAADQAQMLPDDMPSRLSKSLDMEISTIKLRREQKCSERSERATRIKQQLRKLDCDTGFIEGILPPDLCPRHQHQQQHQQQSGRADAEASDRSQKRALQQVVEDCKMIAAYDKELKELDALLELRRDLRPSVAGALEVASALVELYS